jgi:hypothetical protein
VLSDEQVDAKSRQGLRKSIMSYPYYGKFLVSLLFITNGSIASCILYPLPDPMSVEDFELIKLSFELA